MTKRQKYTKAAELIVKGRANYCCIALDIVEMPVNKFHKTFKPKYISKEVGYFDNMNDFGFYVVDKKSQLARSLALLFMAEMEE